MRDLFDNKEKQNKLKIILDSWEDTPFKHHCGVKNKGCDCIHFVARVFEELGLLTLNKVPDYPRDWHLHNTRELLSEAVIKYLSVEKVNLNNLKNGDIILSHYGKASSHAAIYFDGYVYQSIINIGVCKINFEDRKFKKRMKFAYRIKE